MAFIEMDFASGGGGSSEPQSIRLEGTTPANGATWKVETGFKPKYVSIFFFKSTTTAYIYMIDFEENKFCSVYKTSSTSATVADWTSQNIFEQLEDGFQRTMNATLAGLRYTVIASA